MNVLGLSLLCLMFCGFAVAQNEEKADAADRITPTADALKPYPLSSCWYDYGLNCPNTCWKNGMTCCYCEDCWTKTFGKTQTCSCCPRGYKCCPKFNVAPIGWMSQQKCCPLDTECGPAGTSYCIRQEKAWYQQPSCQHCGKWKWPPKNYTDVEMAAKERAAVGDPPVAKAAAPVT